jgi:hypothetical protein
VLAGIAVSAFGAQEQTGLDAKSPDAQSLRTVERLRLDCQSELGREDLTLFANGTVRLRRGPLALERMWLHELGPDELAAFERRLVEDSRSEVPAEHSTVSGSWIERCVLRLELPLRVVEEYRFSRYDALPLALERALAVARDLVVGLDLERPAEGEAFLPSDYEPRSGDVLTRRDGARFRVQNLTVDAAGVELLGLEDPLTLYVTRSELASIFVAYSRPR